MSEFSLEVSFPAERTLRLRLSGHLDDDAARLLLSTSATAAHSISRLILDLGGLTSFTPDGTRALAACRNLACRISEGVTVHTDGGPGRELLAMSAAISA